MQASCVLIEGTCSAEALVLVERLSFWGGLDPATGRIIDPHHPQNGLSITGCLLVLPGTRGSTSAPSALAESIRCNTGPKGIILAERDVTIVVAVTLTAELYDKSIPVVVIETDDYHQIRTGQILQIDPNGRVWL